MKYSILMALCFLVIVKSYGQQEPSEEKTYSFFVKIPNKVHVPTVTHNRNGLRKAYANSNNNTLNRLINSYKIYDCRRVFKNSNSQALKSLYIIECNDLKLMEDLQTKYKQFYPNVAPHKIEYFNNPTHYPDDYGSSGGYLVNQEELDYIRGPEAWGVTTGSGNIKIGVVDTNYTPNHEDLNGTLTIMHEVYPNDVTGDQHGSSVASLAAGNTNNSKGMASMGYNSQMYASVHGLLSGFDELADYPEVKVLNASWGFTNSLGWQWFIDDINEAMDSIVNVKKKVVVAAAGNGYDKHGCSTCFIYPASSKGVISVSSIGHMNKTWGPYETFLDQHEFKENGQVKSFQHNDSIDIVAPGYGILVANPSNGSTNTYTNYGSGTSYAAPIVTGTVALMFDVNYCLDPKEVETILKLTAVKIDTLPVNLPYHGKLGAGKLDAYEAVKMAKDMADATGTVEVKDRILYRPWFYKLETAPYNIKMTNNNISKESKVKFKARNNIEITDNSFGEILYPWVEPARLNFVSRNSIEVNNTDMTGDVKVDLEARNSIEILSGNLEPEPDPGGYFNPITNIWVPSPGIGGHGYINLSIDPNLQTPDLNCPPPPGGSSSKVANSKGKEAEEITTSPETFMVYPNPASDILNIINKEEFTALEIVDMTGKVVFKAEELNTNATIVDIGGLNSGIYFLNIKLNTGDTKTKKIVKD